VGDEAGPLGGGQVVAVEERPQLRRSGRRVRQLVALADVVVVELGIPPGRGRDLVEAIGRAGQTASAGGWKLAVASCSWRSSRPTRQMASSLQGCGCRTSPST